MRLLALANQRSAALAQYDTLSQMLMDEFGVPPAPESDTLYDQILADEITHLAAPPVSSNAQHAVKVLAFTDALQQTWLTRARYGEARRAYVLAQNAALKQEAAWWAAVVNLP